MLKNIFNRGRNLFPNINNNNNNNNNNNKIIITIVFQTSRLMIRNANNISSNCTVTSQATGRFVFQIMQATVQ
jgi:hypothetical protein